MKKLCSILSTVLLILLLLLALAFIVPMLLGYKEMTVLSGSMEPNIPVGSIVCVDDDAPLTELDPGDVITYQLDSSTFVTHRLVSIDSASETLITRLLPAVLREGRLPYPLSGLSFLQSPHPGGHYDRHGRGHRHHPAEHPARPPLQRREGRIRSNRRVIKFFRHFCFPSWF